MSRLKIILILGILASILPYLGFPLTLKNTLISLSGLVIVYLSYILYENDKKDSREQVIFDNFSENHDFVENNVVDNQEISQPE